MDTHLTRLVSSSFFSYLYTLDEVGSDFVIGGLKTQDRASSHKNMTDDEIVVPKSLTAVVNGESDSFQESQSPAQGLNANAVVSPSGTDQEQHQDSDNIPGPADAPSHADGVTADHETETSRDGIDTGSSTKTAVQPCSVGETTHGECRQPETSDQDLSFPLSSQAADSENEKRTSPAVADKVSRHCGAQAFPGRDTFENGRVVEQGTDSAAGQGISISSQASSQEKAATEQEAGSTPEFLGSADHPQADHSSSSSQGTQEMTGSEETPSRNLTSESEICQAAVVEDAHSTQSVSRTTDEAHTANQAGENAELRVHNKQDQDAGSTEEFSLSTDQGNESAGLKDNRDEDASHTGAVSPTTDQPDESAGPKDHQGEKDSGDHNASFSITDNAKGGSSLTLGCGQSSSGGAEGAGAPPDAPDNAKGGSSLTLGCGQSSSGGAEGAGAPPDAPYKHCSRLASDLLRCYLSGDDTDCCLRVNGDAFLAHK